jgi:protein arginine kinase
MSAQGDEPAQILSTRVRLARNLSAIPFTHRARDEQLLSILTSVATAARRSPSLADGSAWKLNDLSQLERAFLLERHLISRDMADARRTRGVLIGPTEAASIMVNEEDHIRIQSLAPGLQLYGAWELADTLDNDLDGILEYAFSDDWGYLTSCPTNVGTGMRVSVLAHLPSLVLTKQISKIVQGLSQMGLAVRGFYGEGSEVMGNFFQVSNQTTLGRSERESLEVLERATRQLLAHEEAARDHMLRDPLTRAMLEDKVWRAYGTLQSARLLTSQEVVNLTSAVRFGAAVDMPGLPETAALNEIVICAQPAHLQVMVGREMDASERRMERARYVRERLARRAAPDGPAAASSTS